MTALIVIHFSACVFLVVVILLQAGKAGMGVGFGSSSQSIFGSKGAGNFLTKTTGICAFVFLSTSFLLTKIQLNQHKSSVIKADTAETAPANTAQPIQAPAQTKPPRTGSQAAGEKDEKKDAKAAVPNTKP